MLFSERADMSTAIRYKIPFSLGSIRAVEPPRISPEPELSVFVVFTSMNGTPKALEKAREMAQSLGAKVAVVAMQVVPFPLPLDEPPVPMGFTIGRFEEMARELSEKPKVSGYLCRDPLEALKGILKPNCPVVMGIKKKWWPTSDERLARQLRRAGYNITLVETE
jgi:hypothetical protein